MSAFDTLPPLEAKHIIGGNVKQAKFDRQLRLWGADGQSALDKAHVLALGVTVAIAEALKSLVLTGVRTLTLVDERVVSSEDVAANYFVAATDIGAPLAEAVLRHVCTLGEDCNAAAVQEAPTHWAAKYTVALEEDWASGCLYSSRQGSGASPAEAQADSAVLRLLTRHTSVADRDTSPSAEDASPDDVSGCTATGKSPLSPPSLILVSERYGDLSSISPLLHVCLTRVQPNAPLLLVRSSGFLGVVQTYSCDRVIMSPQNPTQVNMEDLRIFEPFPALQAWYDAHNPEDAVQFPPGNIDAMTLHSHLPYPCIVHHAFRRWRATLPEGEQVRLQGTPPLAFPLTAQDYRDISSVIAGMVRRLNPPEESFLEAIEKCTPKLNRPVVQKLPLALAELFEDPRCADPMCAVRAVRSRISPSAFQSFSPLVRMEAELLVWECQDVLVWFILQALQLFVTGKIGGDLEVYQAASTAIEVAENTETVAADEVGQAEFQIVQTEAPPYRPPYASYHLPYSGYLPDMTTTTIWYRELQNLYEAKHAEDVRCIWMKAWELLEKALLQDESVGIEGSLGDESSWRRGSRATSLVAERVKPLLHRHTSTVVKNIWDIRGVVFSPAYRAATEAEWRQRVGQRLVWLTRNISFDVDNNPSARRAACLAVAYLTKEEMHRVAIGTSRDHLHGDAIAQEAARLMSQGCRVKDSQDIGEINTTAPHSLDEFVAPWWSDEKSQKLFLQSCEEVARWDRGTGGDGSFLQLPSVAASTGALAAQEAVKLLMRMRVPSGNPMFYDGYTNKVFFL